MTGRSALRSSAIALLIAAGAPAVVRAQATTPPSLFAATGHQSPIGSLAITRNGRFIVTTGLDGRVRLWDFETLTERPGPRFSDAARPWLLDTSDSAVLVMRFGSGDEDSGAIELWDLRTARQLASYGTGSEAAISADGSAVVVVQKDGHVSWHDRATGEKKGATPGSGLRPRLTRVRGNSVVVVYGDRRVVRCQMGEPQCELIAQIPAPPPGRDSRAVDPFYPRMSPDDRHIAWLESRDVVENFTYLVLADLDAGGSSRLVSVLNGAPWSPVAFSPDGRSMAYVGGLEPALFGTDEIILGSQTTRPAQQRSSLFPSAYEQQRSMIESLEGIERRSRSSEPVTVRVVSLETGREIRRWVHTNGEITSLTISPTTGDVVAGTGDGGVVRMPTTVPVAPHIHSLPRLDVVSGTFESEVVVGAVNSTLYVFAVPGRHGPSRIETGSSRVTALSVPPHDHGQVYVGFEDGSFGVWNLATGASIGRWSTGTSAVVAVQPSMPSGMAVLGSMAARSDSDPEMAAALRSVAIRHADGKTVVVDSVSGQPSFTTQVEKASAMLYLPREMLLVGDEAGRIHQFQFNHDTQAMGTSAVVHQAHAGAVSTFGYEPRKERVISAGADGLIQVWDFSIPVTTLPLRTWKAHEGGVSRVWVVADWLTTLRPDNRLRFWSIEIGFPVKPEMPLENTPDVMAGELIGSRLLLSAAGRWTFADVGFFGISLGSVNLAASVRNSVATSDGRFLALAGTGSTKQSSALLQLIRLDGSQEPRAFAGHLAGISRIAFSEDGSRVLTSSNDLRTLLWSTEGSTPIAQLQASPDDIRAALVEADALALDRTGGLAAEARCGVVRVFETRAAPRILHTTQVGEGRCVTRMAFDPDAQLLGMMLANRTFIVMDARTGAIKRESFTRRQAAGRVSWHPAGKFLAVPVSDSTLEILSAADGRVVETIQSSSEPLFSADGRVLFAWRFDAVEIFRVEDWTETARVASEVPLMAVRACGSGILAADERGNLLRLGPEGGAFKTVGRYEAAVGALECGAGRILSARERGAEGGTLEVHDEEFRLLRRTDIPKGTITAIWLAPGGDRFGAILGDQSNRVFVSWKFWSWDVATGTEKVVDVSAVGNYLWLDRAGRRVASLGFQSVDVQSLETGDESEVPIKTGYRATALDIGWHPDGQAVAVVTDDGSLTVTWLDKSRSFDRFVLEADDSKVALTPTRLIAPIDDGTVMEWVWPTEVAFTVADVSGKIQALTVTPDARTVAIVHGEGRLTLVDRAGDDREVDVRVAEWTSQATLRFSPSGNRLAAVDRTGRVVVVDVSTGIVRQMPAIDYQPMWFVFAPDGDVLVSAGQDQLVRFLDARTGVSLATLLVSNDDAQWLAYAPSGLFDGTPGGWGTLSWQFGDSFDATTPVDAFFNEFFAPGLLADALAGRARADVKPPVKSRTPAPTVQVLSAPGEPMVLVNSDTIRLRVVLQGLPGQVVAGVRLLRNSVMVRAWRDPITLDATGGATLDATVPVASGTNAFSAYAFSGDHEKSETAVMPLPILGTRTARPRLWILSIGIDRYANPAFNLRYAAADADAFDRQVPAAFRSAKTALTSADAKARVEAVRKVLEERSSGLDALMLDLRWANEHFDDIKVIPLRNGNATRGRIVQALEQLAREVTVDDTVMIFFAGHGMARGRNFYLVPHDLGYRGPANALTPEGIDQLAANGVSDDMLERLFDSLDARRLVLIVDACQSGQVLESAESRRGPLNVAGLAQLAYEKGMTVLTASQSFQAALEVERLKHGLLTYTLLTEGLDRKNADRGPRDGAITLDEWLQFAVRRVPEVQREVANARAARGLTTRISLQHQQPRLFTRRDLDLLPLVMWKDLAAPVKK